MTCCASDVLDFSGVSQTRALATRKQNEPPFRGKAGIRMRGCGIVAS